MDIYVLNRNIETIGLIDSYKSVIWTPRFYEPGDFELYLPATTQNIDLLKNENMLVRDKDVSQESGVITYENVMIIESVALDTDEENGDFLTVTGRCLKSILDRRIIWNQTMLDGNLQDMIFKLINENAVAPENPSRKIERLRLKNVRGAANQVIKMQVTGDNLSEFIISLCKTYKVGYDIAIEGEYFYFYLKNWTDRSRSQNVNPHVVFSPDFDNLLRTSYLHSLKDFKNVAKIAGEGEGLDRISATFGNDSSLTLWNLVPNSDFENGIDEWKYSFESVGRVERLEVIDGFLRTTRTEEGNPFGEFAIEKISPYEILRGHTYGLRVKARWNSTRGAGKFSFGLHMQIKNPDDFEEKTEWWHYKVIDRTITEAELNNWITATGTMTYDPTPEFEDPISQGFIFVIDDEYRDTAQGVPNGRTVDFDELMAIDFTGAIEKGYLVKSDIPKFMKEMPYFNVSHTLNESFDLNRREMYIDARDISSNDGEITMHEYYNLLEERGRTTLADNPFVETFEGQIETKLTYTIGEDYVLGDKVTVINEYGIESDPQVIEIIESEDDTGINVIPTFSKFDLV